MLFETGHPWITFKDPCNIRSPQHHAGVVHSSNLCTEITLNTSVEEIAVCNLGSVNLPHHVDRRRARPGAVWATVKTAMRMLDNVIDINFYTVPKARDSNLRHRPVGLGVMGFQDALLHAAAAYASEAAVGFADESMEAISYYAISASVELAAERGRYQSFEGSLWSKGVLPIDSIELLARGRGGTLEARPFLHARLGRLRERVKSIGMRNSNTMAIAPTATISNICGVSQSIEPTYQNLFVKSNLSGDFTVVNAALVRDLKARGLWDEVMVSDLKYFDGGVGEIDRIPDDLKALYATAFEIDATWLIEAAARRQKWIDQAQSLNLYIANPSGKKLDDALPAGLAARPEDHLLPALALGHACREIDAERHRRQAQRGCRRSHRRRAGSGCAARRPRLRGLPLTTPLAKPANSRDPRIKVPNASDWSSHESTSDAAAVDANAAAAGRARLPGAFPSTRRHDQLPRRREPLAAAEISLGMG